MVLASAEVRCVREPAPADFDRADSNARRTIDTGYLMRYYAGWMMTMMARWWCGRWRDLAMGWGGWSQLDAKGMNVLTPESCRVIESLRARWSGGERRSGSICIMNEWMAGINRNWSTRWCVHWRQWRAAVEIVPPTSSFRITKKKCE